MIPYTTRDVSETLLITTYQEVNDLTLIKFTLR